MRTASALAKDMDIVTEAAVLLDVAGDPSQTSCDVISSIREPSFGN